MAQAANALVTTANQRVYQGLEVDTHTALLELLIDSISTLFDNYTGRNLIKATYTAIYFDGNGEKELQLPNWPVDTASDFTLYEDDVLLTEGIDDDFVLYETAGYVRKYGGVWLDAPKSIKLTYSAGYAIASVPADLKLAVYKQVAHEFHKQANREWGKENRSMPDGSVSLITDNLLPDVEEILDRYRKL